MTKDCLNCGHKLKKKKLTIVAQIFRIDGYVCQACGLEVSYRKEQIWYGFQKEWTGMMEVPEGCLLVFDKPV